MATKNDVATDEEESPPKSLRDEALEVVKEWRDELQAGYAENPAEYLIGDLALVNQLIALLEPTATHYQT